MREQRPTEELEEAPPAAGQAAVAVGKRHGQDRQQHGVRRNIRFSSRFSPVSVASVALAIAAWTVVAALADNPARVPSPLGLFETFVDLLNEGYLGRGLGEHALASLQRTLLGFFIGAAVGVPLGLLMGFNRRIDQILGPFFAFARPIPPIAFIPVVVLYFGLGETGKVLLIVYASLTYVVINSRAGALQVPQAFLRAAQMLGLSGPQRFVLVTLPSAAPYIASGLRTAMSISWAVVVAAELVGAQAGLGFIASNAGQLFQVQIVFVAVIMIGVIGLILDGVIDLLDRKIVHWRGK